MKKCGEAKIDHRNWLAAIIDSSDDAIIFKDLDGIIMTWNKGAERIFGYSAAEALGRHITLLDPPDRRHEEDEILARIRRGERIEHYETVGRHKDGHLIDISLTASPVRDDDGQIIGASKVARDITRRKKAEQEAGKAMEREKAARQEAETATRTKDHFLATLSHELRTPLSPILLVASDAASNDVLPEEIREQFQTIVENAEVLVRLIDDLLDLSRITNGKVKIKTQELDAHNVLREAVNLVHRDIENKQIHLTAKLNASGHLISADSVRLQQIFWNILRNAVKFTPEKGEIKIETFSTEKKFMAVVKDSGIGMTSEEMGRIFAPFSQGDHPNGGLGLGLSISQKLAELQSGYIRASSGGRGQGSTFSIEFPLLSKACAPDSGESRRTA